MNESFIAATITTTARTFDDNISNIQKWNEQEPNRNQYQNSKINYNYYCRCCCCCGCSNISYKTNSFKPGLSHSTGKYVELTLCLLYCQFLILMDGYLRCSCNFPMGPSLSATTTSALWLFRWPEQKGSEALWREGSNKKEQGMAGLQLLIYYIDKLYKEKPMNATTPTSIPFPSHKHTQSHMYSHKLYPYVL